MKSLNINESFKNLLRPLTQEEKKSLTASILSAGKIINPIIVFKGTDEIVDGYHRYDIASTYQLPFQVEEMEFESEAEAMKWIYKNQAGRRNMTEAALSEVRALISKMFATGQTVTSVAKDLGISKPTASRELTRHEIGEAAGDHETVRDLPVKQIEEIAKMPKEEQAKIVAELRKNPGQRPAQVLIKNTDVNKWNKQMEKLRGVIPPQFYQKTFPDCEYISGDVRNNVISAAELLYSALDDCTIVPCVRCAKVKGECKACGGRKFITKSLARMYGG